MRAPWAAAILLAACTTEPREVDCVCANVQQKAWFIGEAAHSSSVLKADDATVLAVAGPETQVATWRIDEDRLVALVDAQPPREVASFAIRAHLDSEPDPESCCGHSVDFDAHSWQDTNAMMVDFWTGPIPLPGLFEEDVEFQPGLPVGLDDDEWAMFRDVSIGAGGGRLPQAFAARHAGSDDWSLVVVRHEWAPTP